ncbi:MAG: LysR family transcriptional regulator [Tistlia sp.]|uniref:LysR family transcriptional regulator n=1 Tax=Tistlia sp. TaxID=3057121 RepID=UPI0034A1D43E
MVLRPNLASRSIIGQLTTFVAVAETRSFRAAAEQIGRSQPAVTAQVNQLEALLGVRLFTRTTRQVAPTLAGRELLARAKRLVVETDELIRDFQSHGALTQGRVAISSSPTLATGLIARALVHFEREHPGIAVSIREDFADELFEALATGHVEIGIGPYSQVPERLAFRPVLEQPFLLIVPRGHALARRRRLTFGELEGQPMVCPATGTTARSLIEAAARAAGFALTVKCETMQYQTVASMVAAGLGITVMPAVDRRVLAALDLVALPFADLDLFREVGVISRRHEEPSPAARAFLSLLSRLTVEAGELERDGLRPLSAGR